MRSQGSGQEGLRAWTAPSPAVLPAGLGLDGTLTRRAPCRAWPGRHPHPPCSLQGLAWTAPSPTLCSLKLVWRCAGIPQHPIRSCLPQACPLPMSLHTGLPLAFGDQAGPPLQPAGSVHLGLCLLSTATTTITSRVPVKSMIICAVRDKGQMGGTRGERTHLWDGEGER